MSRSKKDVLKSKFGFNEEVKRPKKKQIKTKIYDELTKDELREFTRR